MPNRADNLGYDTYVGPQADGSFDMTRDGRTCSGPTLVANSLISRCMAKTIKMSGAPGGVIDWGDDVRGWVGAAGDLTGKASLLAVYFARERRINPGTIRVQITKTTTGARYAFTIGVQATCVDGSTIDLLLGVTGATVERIARG